MTSALILQPIMDFYSHVAAFDGLPKPALQILAGHTLIDYVGRNTPFLIQGETRLDHVYIVKEGAIALFDSEDNPQDWDILDEGRLYGGLSLLRNKGVSLRSAKTLEDTFFYLLPRDPFIEICAQYSDVKDYFFNRLTARYHRSQQALRSRRMQVRCEDETYIMHLSVADAATSPVIRCQRQTSLKEGAEMMTAGGTGCLLVLDDSQRLSGIITDSDLRRHVVAGDVTSGDPVTSVLQSPVKTIVPEATVLEALMLMLQHKLSYLPVVDGQGQISGVLSASALPQVQRQSLLTLLWRVSEAPSPEALNPVKKDLASVVRSLFQEGYAVEHIATFITHVNDAVLAKLIGFAEEKLGPPPCAYAFITMGSEGRSEQTLLVDQDNAIILADPLNPKINQYFTNLGALVCTWLDNAGYCYCNGYIMANNPDWRLCLDEWKAHFTRWVHEPEALAVMHGQIFFDLRVVYGDVSLGDDLMEHLMDLCSQRSDIFFYHLAAHQLEYSPPLGFFRNFIVVSKGDHKEAFDIKKAMNAVVGFARIFALKMGVKETNTMRRLMALHREGLLGGAELEELKRGYFYMMSLRLHHQEALLEAGTKPNNFVNPHQMSNLDQDILKAVFRLISRLQQRVRQQFPGPS